MDQKKEPSNSQNHPNTNSEKPNQKADSPELTEDSPLQRFQKSMKIDYEKWHDGIGYDVDAITSASPAERKAIEQILIHHTPRDWRDIEALAKIDTKKARETIKNAIEDPNPDVRIAVTRFAPNPVTNSQRSQSIISSLQRAEIFGGLSQALDDVEEYHPAEVKETLIRGLLTREGEVAVLFAAMLFYICGKANEPFDINNAPSFCVSTPKTKRNENKHSENYVNN